MNYIPRKGDSICAKRKIESSIYPNTVVGPVTDVWMDGCRVVTNYHKSNEGQFNLQYRDWSIKFLFVLPDTKG